ncbi:hypothetical protein STXM2123_2979 [Streptomyces sp. F-3]|nr:hypothetical protein STXM2123_2979 [Streptomyces sp. F-3]
MDDATDDAVNDTTDRTADNITDDDADGDANDAVDENEDRKGTEAEQLDRPSVLRTDVPPCCAQQHAVGGEYGWPRHS